MCLLGCRLVVVLCLAVLQASSSSLTPTIGVVQQYTKDCDVEFKASNTMHIVAGHRSGYEKVDQVKSDLLASTKDAKGVYLWIANVDVFPELEGSLKMTKDDTIAVGVWVRHVIDVTTKQQFAKKGGETVKWFVGTAVAKIDNSKTNQFRQFPFGDFLGELTADHKWPKHGRLTMKNGDSYAGGMYGDKRHGNGGYEYNNGNKYQGMWHSDNKHGWGAFFFADGKPVGHPFTYEGNWKDNKQHGPGLIYTSDGVLKLKVHYENGHPKKGVQNGVPCTWKEWEDIKYTQASHLYYQAVIKDPVQNHDFKEGMDVDAKLKRDMAKHIIQAEKNAKPEKFEL